MGIFFVIMLFVFIAIGWMLFAKRETNGPNTPSAP